MINEQDFSHLFSDFVIADSNPFKLSTQETYKEGGELKSKTNDINIDLAEVNSPIDLILTNNNFEIVEYYKNKFIWCSDKCRENGRLGKVRFKDMVL